MNLKCLLLLNCVRIIQALKPLGRLAQMPIRKSPREICGCDEQRSSAVITLMWLRWLFNIGRACGCTCLFPRSSYTSCSCPASSGNRQCRIILSFHHQEGGPCHEICRIFRYKPPVHYGRNKNCSHPSIGSLPCTPCWHGQWHSELNLLELINKIVKPSSLKLIIEFSKTW